MAEKPKRVLPPRVVFYPNPELLDALKELQDSTGASISGFVTEVLTQSIPMIRQISMAARLAKQRDIAALDVMNQALQAALAQGQQMSLDMANKAPQIRSMLARGDDEAKE